MDTTITMVELVIPELTSVCHPEFGGAAYKSDGYIIKHSPTLTRTGKNYYDSLKEIPDRFRISTFRISTATEELAIQLALEKAGEDPRKAKVFDDLFGRNNNGWYAWQWTLTGLRVPKDYRADKHEKDTQGRIHYLRIVLIGDEEVGEILVPEGDGRVVVEWDEVFGLPKTTEEMDWPHNPYTTHFWFDPSPSKDEKSGQCDVAVARCCYWHRVAHEGCLYVYASCGRWHAGSDGGFRLVQGSFFAPSKNITDWKEDFRHLPIQKFIEKYGL
jgi:hypothetical protein